MSPAARQICGMALVVIGLIAMPLPVVPGLPIVAAGAALLGTAIRSSPGTIHMRPPGNSVAGGKRRHNSAITTTLDAA